MLNSFVKSVPNFGTGFYLLLLPRLVSGLGSSIVPIAFAIESLRIDETGFGFTSVVAALWLGKLSGAHLYSKANHLFSIFNFLALSLFILSVVQFCLYAWVIVFSSNIFAFTVGSLVYGVVLSFLMPSFFISIKLVTDEENREQANSVWSIASDFFSIIGPSLGAIAILKLSFANVLLIEAIAFLIALLLVLFVLFRSDQVEPKNVDNEKEPSESLNENKEKIQFPKWVKYGFISWFGVCVGIGLAGVAGPTLIISMYSEIEWAFVATSLAVGSLCGSAFTLSGRAKSFTWAKIHSICITAFALQLLFFAMPSSIWLVCFFGFWGSLGVTASGIKWDTAAQNQLSAKSLRLFASQDQNIVTTGTALGMFVFGVSNWAGVATEVTFLVAAFVLFTLIPLKNWKNRAL